jgi:hypothetical protein
MLKPKNPLPEPFFNQDFSLLAKDRAFSSARREPLEVFEDILRGSLPRVAVSGTSLW